MKRLSTTPCKPFFMGVNDEASISVVITIAASDCSRVIDTNSFWKRAIEAE